MDYLNTFIENINVFAAAYAPKVLLAAITLIVGLWVVKRIGKLFSKMMDRNNIDVSLRSFLNSIISVLLKTLLVISVVSMVGVEATSFVAILASVGFAIGMALQGSLGNFAGGVLILVFKPYKVGDVIEAQGFIGAVNSIQVFNTILKTPDNKTIIIPNGPMSGGPITNLSTEENRRVDNVFGIGYGDDIAKAKKVISRVIEANDKILSEPAPAILVAELADSSVNFSVRTWAKSEDYWAVYFDMHEKVKLAFDNEGISIPFPQRDLHVHNQ